VAVGLRQRLGLQSVRTCAVCEHAFPPEALRGRISCKAIVEQRARWGITELKRRDIAPGALYEERRVCVFCAQFFDEQVLWLDAVDEEIRRPSPSRSAARRSASRSRQGASLFDGSFADSADGLMTPGRSTAVDTSSFAGRTPQSVRPAGLNTTQTTGGDPTSSIPPTPASTSGTQTPPKPHGSPALRRANRLSPATENGLSESRRRKLEDDFCSRILLSAAAARQGGGPRRGRQRQDQGAAQPRALSRGAPSVEAAPTISAELHREFGPAHSGMNRQYLANRAKRTSASPVLDPTDRAKRVAAASAAVSRSSFGGSAQTKSQLLERARARMRRQSASTPSASQSRHE
jgi:hypothetical protein